MASGNRPLSPHLQVYKPQLTSILSITHRATGVFLSLGAIFLSCWLLSIAMGPESYAKLQECITSWFGQLCLLGFVFSLYYHLANGIRHLFWDIGKGLTIETTYMTGYIVVAFSIILTAVTWLAASTGGAA